MYFNPPTNIYTTFTCKIGWIFFSYPFYFILLLLPLELVRKFLLSYNTISVWNHEDVKFRIEQTKEKLREKIDFITSKYV